MIIKFNLKYYRYDNFIKSFFCYNFLIFIKRLNLDFFIYLIVILIITWIYVLFFKKESIKKEVMGNPNIEQNRKPLSRETLRNINENSEFKNNNIYKNDFLIAKVVGVTNKNYDNKNHQDILKECKEDEQLMLVKEIDNRFSRYAIKVCRLNGDQLGYLEDKLSQKIYFRDMSTASVYIDEIIGGTENKPNLGCLIEIQFE